MPATRRSSSGSTTQVVYVVPRVNPDGAEPMFAAVRTGRRTNLTPVDADNDGRIDEDGPEDLNKDGVITVMRVKDPTGPYMISPDDPRLMKRADPAKGETGGWAIYWEGRDADRDGFIAEDGPGGVDINRNFMHQYPYFEPDAGRHMASEAETRAVLDFMLKHRNIAAILTFGESDNLVTPPNRRGELAPANPINLVDFADRSTLDSRKVGIFQEPTALGGRGGRGFVMMDDEGGFPGGRGGQGPQLTGRAALPARRPATTVNPGGRRVPPGDQRQVPRADRPPQHRLHTHAGRRVLRVRLLPVRRPVVLDARLGPARCGRQARGRWPWPPAARLRLARRRA